MFAINHAAAALAIKRKYPTVSLVLILISVQLMEFVWVVLNLIGIERTTTHDSVDFVGDIQLAHMPWSHSVATMLGVATIAWLLLGKVFRRARLSAAVGIGIASHLALDLLTHQRDLQLAPFIAEPKLGLGFYGSAPLAAFALELGFGLWCWWYYRGSKSLLAVIVIFNLANISMFTSAIRGPETWLAGHPTTITTVIFGQIAATLALVWFFARAENQPTTQNAATARTE